MALELAKRLIFLAFKACNLVSKRSSYITRYQVTVRLVSYFSFLAFEFNRHHKMCFVTILWQRIMRENPAKVALVIPDSKNKLRQEANLLRGKRSDKDLNL